MKGELFNIQVLAFSIPHAVLRIHRAPLITKQSGQEKAF